MPPWRRNVQLGRFCPEGEATTASAHSDDDAGAPLPPTRDVSSDLRCAPSAPQLHSSDRPAGSPPAGEINRKTLIASLLDIANAPTKRQPVPTTASMPPSRLQEEAIGESSSALTPKPPDSEPPQVLLEAAQRRELDVAALSSTNPDAYVDVTVRHAPSDHYMPRAAEVDGATFVVAEGDKRRTYPTRGGYVVTTFATETYGRVSDAMHEAMRELAQLAAESDRARGLQARRRLSGWRASVSTVLAKAMAESWLASTAFPCGTNKRPARYPASHLEPGTPHHVPRPNTTASAFPTQVEEDPRPDPYTRRRMRVLRARFREYRMSHPYSPPPSSRCE